MIYRLLHESIISTKFLFILNSARALRTTTQYIIIYLGNVRTTCAGKQND